MRFVRTRESCSFPQPCCESRFRYLAFRQAKILWVQVEIIGFEGGPVQLKKSFTGHCGSAFVAVDEGMISGEPKGQRCRQVRQVRHGVAIGVQLLGPGQCGFEQSFIAKLGSTAMF